MTFKQRVLAKPGAVQAVLKVFMAHPGLNPDEPLDPHDEVQMERIAEAALQRWEATVRECREAGGHSAARASRKYLSEAKIAERVIEELRKQEGWGKVLRGDAN